MLVCTSWCRASRDPFINSVFNLETHFESPYWSTQEFEGKIDSMLRSVVQWSNGSLTEIRTRHCSDLALTYAAERCPNLQVLSIKECTNVTDASMFKIALRCSKLRELDISYSYGISHESLAVVKKKCPKLKVLKRNIVHCLGIFLL